MINRKSVIIVLIMAIVLVALGVYLVRRNNPDSGQQPSALDTQNKSLEEARKIDSDLDGLSNIEEAKLGTNAESADTDQDGLLDKDEVNKFKTDPLKADTDGDGKKDGYEVRRGMNPLKGA